jgi:signal-transduction protein with cAMP-binding, CBS, and nucleotidyltransferase domain/heme/copper-type cytochrome/quinol oxidase subunit 2
MAKRDLNKFFFSVVMPSILAIALFVISFFVFVIPFFEENMMDRKKEMILELTNTAVSVLDEYNVRFQNGEFSLDEAKRNATIQIEQMRYGAEGKDYFWIIDYTPTMVMHPYRKELDGQDLRNYKDSHEKTLFTDAAGLVQKQNEGFIEYHWQWKDDITRVVPKLSYVKGYPEWKWIVGTGIYVDDVNQEIANLKRHLLTISSIIVGIIVLTLIYVIRQSLNIENRRRSAEQKLWLSRQKYKSLVDASTEGTLMIVEGRVVFVNMKFSRMLDLPVHEISELTFDEIFEVAWEQVTQLFGMPNKSVNFETHIKKPNGELKETVLSISKIDYSGRNGIIVIAKDIGKQLQLEKETEKLSSELQTSLHLMNQPIKVFVKELHSCRLETPIHEVARKMAQHRQKVMFVGDGERIIGVVNDTDIKNRVVAENVDLNSPVSQFMTSPIATISENSLLFEAILKFQKKGVSHLLVIDSGGYFSGVLSNQDCLEMQRNSLSFMIKEIEDSDKIDDLRKIYSRLPVIINSLIYSGDTVRNITRIISTVADAITCRVIDLALDKYGEAPCEFAFMTMGSVGREEQTLKTDQDNAIVFSGDDRECQPYFLELAGYVNDKLDYIGYESCDGGVMASNPKWCASLKTWKDKFAQWTRSPDIEQLLDSKIFFDFRYVYGDASLTARLREHLYSLTSGNRRFFHDWSQTIIKYKPQIENDVIDLKMVLFPITGYLRIKAYFFKLSQTNSLERLEQLKEVGNLTDERINEIEKMYAFTMQLRIKNQVQAILRNDAPENTVERKTLSKIEQDTLKRILSEINKLQSELGADFRSSGEA